jgi:glycosyltransferase involved in cell wall biosynthesis
VTNPTISIALCTFNGAQFLDQQLASLFDQTLPPNEIVICDDGSTDDTLGIIDSYSNRYPDIFRVFKNQLTLGPRKNFEQAIGLCTGEFIFLCDQDDIWLPEKIEKCIQALESDPTAQGVFCNGWLMNEEGQSLCETMWDALYWENALQQITNRENLLAYLLLNGNIVTGTALCIRQSACASILPLQTEYNTWHDHWIAMVLAACKSLIWIPQPLLQYRIHAQQQVGFSGRGMADPHYRQAVHDCWLFPHKIGQWQTTHLAWGVQGFERYEPLLMKAAPHAAKHISYTGQQIHHRFKKARNAWLKTIPWRARKWKLIKHWLHGGEYLRIGFADILSI